MGIAFGKLLNTLFGKKQARIVMVGLDAAGKTTILHKMAFGETVNTIPTIGFTLQSVKHGRLEFDVWDIGGQTELRHLWKHYYRNADGVIFVVDSSDKLVGRMSEAKQALKGVVSSEELVGVPLLVLANKQDIDGAMKASEIDNMLSCIELRADREIKVEECSALTGVGLDDGLKWLSGAVEKSWEAKKVTASK